MSHRARWTVGPLLGLPQGGSLGSPGGDLVAGPGGPGLGLAAWKPDPLPGQVRPRPEEEARPGKERCCRTGCAGCPWAGAIRATGRLPDPPG